jgi:hypothetical protein
MPYWAFRQKRDDRTGVEGWRTPHNEELLMLGTSPSTIRMINVLLYAIGLETCCTVDVPEDVPFDVPEAVPVDVPEDVPVANIHSFNISPHVYQLLPNLWKAPYTISASISVVVQQ